MMNTWAILLAAGTGSRLKSAAPCAKQFLPYNGLPLFWHSALLFARVPGIRGIVFVFPPDANIPDAAMLGVNIPDVEVSGAAAISGAALPGTPGFSRADTLLQSLEAQRHLGLPYRIARGGERRQDSVMNGLAAVPQECDSVLVHDSARPFASAALCVRVLDALNKGARGVVPGVAVADTIKSVDAKGFVVHTPAREGLRAVQTPQGFALAPLVAAHKKAEEEGWNVTDDASLLERCGTPVLIVEGDMKNSKVTTPEDLALLEGGESRESSAYGVPCSGFGYDVHRYGGDRPFILGGVPIACDVRIAAHSDGDTLLHALMDAILGCIGGGDIGGLFPDNDPTFENISSGILLAEVLRLARDADFTLAHVDITIVAQTPRIAPHRQAIAVNLEKLLGLARGMVNVKATTEEHLGFTGEKKGIKVMALVSGVRGRGLNTSVARSPKVSSSHVHLKNERGPEPCPQKERPAEASASEERARQEFSQQGKGSHGL